jgi:type I restriction enzyme S subunit
MRTKPLGEIIRMAPTIRAGDAQYPILSMTMRHGLVEQSAKFKKRIASVDTSPYRVVTRGQLVVGFPIDEAVLSFQRLYDQAIVSPAYEIWNMVDSSTVDRAYLERYLRSPLAIAYYSSKLQGTTARRRNLPKDVFLAMPVPVPSYDEQVRIGRILQQGDDLHARRQTSVSIVDELAWEIFFDMFGDPVRNDRAWPRLPLSRLVERIESGYSPVCLGRPAEDGEWGVLKLGAITTGEYIPGENKALVDLDAVDPENEVNMGDLLFSRKNTRALVGASVLVTETPARLLMPDLIFRLVLKEDAAIDKCYLHRLMTYPAKRREIQVMANGSAGSMPNIPKARLMELPLELPPLSLQREFAERIRSITALKARHREQAAEFETLFVSLQHRAFRGEL